MDVNGHIGRTGQGRRIEQDACDGASTTQLAQATDDGRDNDNAGAGLNGDSNEQGRVREGCYLEAAVAQPQRHFKAKGRPEEEDLQKHRERMRGGRVQKFADCQNQ